MQKSVAVATSVEFLQRLKFVAHLEEHGTNLEIRKPGKGKPRLKMFSLFPGFMDSRSNSFQFGQFRFDLLEVGQCMRIVIALCILDDPVAIDNEHCAL